MTAQAGSASLPSPSHASERQRLRRDMRARRRALSALARRDAALRFPLVAARSRLLRPGLRVGFYVAHDGEADPIHLLARARTLGCQIFLPVITDYRRNRMQFVQFDASEPLVANRFGIAEPKRGRPVATHTLDLVFVPLVAADPKGVRLGSGAGFYDRCLVRLRACRRWRRPKLIGLAYEFQRVTHIPAAPWDVPLDAVLTENALHRTRGIHSE